MRIAEDLGFHADPTLQSAALLWRSLPCPLGRVYHVEPHPRRGAGLGVGCCTFSSLLATLRCCTQGDRASGEGRAASKKKKLHLRPTDKRHKLGKPIPESSFLTSFMLPFQHRNVRAPVGATIMSVLFVYVCVCPALCHHPRSDPRMFVILFKKKVGHLRTAQRNMSTLGVPSVHSASLMLRHRRTPDTRQVLSVPKGKALTS